MSTITDSSFRDRFSYRLVVLGRRWHQMVDAVLQAYGLSHATWRPLLHLANFAEAPRQCELADSLEIGNPALVRLIDNLEKKGLVQRADVEGDRRAKCVQLTPEGRRIARRVHDIIGTLERQLMKDVTTSDVAHCDRVFERIQQQIAVYTPPPRVSPRTRRA